MERRAITMPGMSKRFVAVLALSVLCVGIVARAAQSSSLVRHVVVFKYGSDATPQQIQGITDALVALKDRIPGIVSIETGVNNSPENLNKGFTHVFLVTFTDARARDAYLPHPAHQEFGKLLRSSGIFEDVFVVDFTPGQ